MAKNNNLNNVLFLQKCIVVNDKGRILALKRNANDRYRAGCWDLPGGTYEKGEDVIASIKREVKEEVHLIITDPRPVYVASGQNFSSEFMSGENVFAVCHVCDDWQGEVTISDEHTEYRWVDPAELATYNYGSDGGFFKHAIEQYIKMSVKIV